MLRPAGYREYQPHHDLADIVACFWTTSGGGPAPFRILPDGCIDLVFDFLAPPGKGAALIGAMRRARLVEPIRPPDMLGVRFRPGGLSACFRLDAAALTDSRLDIALFWPGGRVLWNRLGEAEPGTRVAVAAACLRALRCASPDLLVRHCVRRIETAGGVLRIAALDRASNARQIERRFAALPHMSAYRPSGLRASCASTAPWRSLRMAGRIGPDWRSTAATATSPIWRASSRRCPD